MEDTNSNSAEFHIPEPQFEFDGFIGIEACKEDPENPGVMLIPLVPASREVTKPAIGLFTTILIMASLIGGIVSLIEMYMITMHQMLDPWLTLIVTVGGIAACTGMLGDILPKLDEEERTVAIILAYVAYSVAVGIFIGFQLLVFMGAK